MLWTSQFCFVVFDALESASSSAQCITLAHKSRAPGSLRVSLTPSVAASALPVSTQSSKPDSQSSCWSGFGCDNAQKPNDGFRIDAESDSSPIRDMATCFISKAKPKLGVLVRQAASGKTICLLNGKDMVALVPAHPTHDAAVALDVAAVNRRLAASEQSPPAPWNPGDAGRLAQQVLRKPSGP